MGSTASPFKHSPAHTGFSRANAIANGFAWVASVMDDDEWMEPPVDHLLDYVPVGARPLFAEQFREMLWWLERDSRNEARWFLLDGSLVFLRRGTTRASRLRVQRRSGWSMRSSWRR
jgi:hypothetical protein